MLWNCYSIRVRSDHNVEKSAYILRLSSINGRTVRVVGGNGVLHDLECGEMALLLGLDKGDANLKERGRELSGV